jgi:site-specific DNA recombinase
MRAAIYTRISLDRSGEGAGVERQRADCEALCAARGWEILDVFEDNDRSAYNGKERPAYERLTALVASGDVDVVVAWHPDRLWRSVLEQQTFLVLGRDAGLKLVATPTAEYDPADGDDSFMQTLLTAVAQKESADKSRRMRRRQADKAERGEFHGGRRAFGHNANRTKIVAKEAKLIREAARRVLGGEEMMSVCNDFIRRSIPSATGGRWRSDTLKSLLQQPRLAGLRDHHGQVVADATWPAILDRDTHERLVALFAARRRGPVERPARKNLLVRLLRCSRCGRFLLASAMSKDVPRYLCPPPAKGGCSGVTIVARRAEERVRDLVLEHLDTPEFARALQEARQAATENDHDVAALLDQVTRDRARLLELGDMLADGELSRAEYGRLTAKVELQITDAESRLARAETVIPADLEGQGARLAEAWEAMTLDEKRTLIGAVAECFVVKPAPRPRNVFQPERVQPVWRF